MWSREGLSNYAPECVWIYSNQYFDYRNKWVFKFNVDEKFLCKTSKFLCEKQLTKHTNSKNTV